MAAINYLDFDLLIQREGEGYRAQVVDSPAGQAASKFKMPFSDLELENFLLRVGRTRRGVRRIDSPEVKAAKSFGERLFAAVFDGEVRGCLRSSLDEAGRQGGGLRIRLRMTEVPELADMPWEYLYNPILNRFLALSVETPLVRYLDLPERIRPLSVRPPLRVLVMISSPSDYPRLDVEREWSKLSESLSDLERRGLVVLERLEEATLASLQRRLRRGEYHILHFIGHGGFEQATQDGVLILEDEQERGRSVSGQELGTLLHDHRSMRLAILNACEGARTSRTDPFAGTAQSLAQQGIPAVIAMQFEITDEAAVTFAQEFYGAVADGYPADAALAEARKAIFAQGNGLEWGTPVLYLRCPDGIIFNVERVVTQASETEVQEPHKHREEFTEGLTKTRDTSSEQPGTTWLIVGAAGLLLFVILAIVWMRGGDRVGKTPPPAQIVSLAVHAGKQELKPKESTALKAKGKYSDGSEGEIVEGVEWRSSDSSVAPVGPDGRLEAQRGGSAEITARYKGVVSPPLIVSVKTEKQPAPPSPAAAPTRLVSLTVHADKREIEVQGRASLGVRGRYSDGKEDEISQGVQWQSSDRAIATVNPQGQVAGQKEGSVDITARHGGIVSSPLTLFIKGSKEKPTVTTGAKRPEPESSVKNGRIRDHMKAASRYREQGEYSNAFSELEKARAIDPAHQGVQSEIEITRRACNAEKRLGNIGLRC